MIPKDLEKLALPNEEWRHYIEGYWVSNQGRVYTCKRNKFMKFLKSKENYNEVNLTIQGKHKHALVHRMVAEVFIEKPEGKDYINHIDGNKKNNFVENLEWVDYRENMQHAIDTGLIKHYDNMLTEDEVQAVIILWRTGKYTQKSMAEFMNTSVSTISRVICNKAPETKKRKKNNMLTPEDKDRIRELYASGNYKQKELCEMFNVSAGNMSTILKAS